MPSVVQFDNHANFWGGIPPAWQYIIHHRYRLARNHIHRYVTAIIEVRSRKLIVVDINGEIIHDSDFNLSRELR